MGTSKPANNNIHGSLLAVPYKLIVFFPLFEQFSYSNTSWSQPVPISDVLLHYMVTMVTVNTMYDGDT